MKLARLQLGLVGTVAVSFVLGCHAVGGAPRTASPVEELAQWMEGSFSSEAQAQLDPENYFDIRLFMTPIWTERRDGPWLYVEQAAGRALERPYRQRVYHLVEERDGGVRSEVYLLPGDPLTYAGAWATPEVFAISSPDLLNLREGCDIILHRVGELWMGSTEGQRCPSSLGGASYATSEVTIGPGYLQSWDRGFDAQGEQVWGATEGPYDFLKAQGGSD